MRHGRLRGRVLVAGVVVALAGWMLGPLPSCAGEKIFEKKTPKNSNDLIYGGRGVTGKSAVAGVLSLIIPGVGQLINKNKPAKAIVHFVLGLPVFVGGPVGAVFGLWHFWSGWDGLIDRPGGYMDGHLKAPLAEEIYDAGLGIASANC